MKKTYGEIFFDKKNESWVIKKLEPHVSIRLKNLFRKIPSHKPPPFYLKHSPDLAADLKWFMDRYHLKISVEDKKLLTSENKSFYKNQAEAERILLPNWKPSTLAGIINGNELKPHQLVAVEFSDHVKRLLLVDAIGTGKSYISIGAALSNNSLPAAFVVQTHLPNQFKEKIENFSNLKVHIIKSGKPYSLPKADIYIFRYSILGGWVDIFQQGFFKFAMFDEIQELRHGTSTVKGSAAKVLSLNVEKVLGTTGTPIYGYGIEMFNVMDIIKEGILGTRNDFVREWCEGNEKLVKEPNALGTYLRESQSLLRRSKKDIYGKQIEPNIIIEKVDYDEESVKSTEDLAKKLAIKTLTGDFHESGMAARELNSLLRHYTGISKAKSVAFFVRMLVESGEKVILAGWHRDVYEIWLKELKDLDVVMYTGTESPAQKEKNKNDFINGKAKVMIISHISGAGLDGLQYSCSTVVLGELSWSKEIHNQIIGRVNREGQLDPVSVFILLSDFGSDPIIMDILGLKHNQQKGILDPNEKFSKVNSDRSKLKLLAEAYLDSKNIKI